jgi:hypothetical protein
MSVDGYYNASLILNKAVKPTFVKDFVFKHDDNLRI